MSTAHPTPTPLPVRSEATAQPDDHTQGRTEFEIPKLRFNILNLTHPGASRFLAATNAAQILSQSVETVLRLLYQTPSNPSIPGTRSVTLVLEDMDGVAYTKGSDLDNDHKEIHFSLNYIKGIKSAPDGHKTDTTGAYEIRGVLVHELVHCFQHNGQGTCPGGLVEGIADWVRLRANLAPSHWKRDQIPDRWDRGYEKTAYFLDWLEGKFGEGTVRKINDTLRVQQYKSGFWKALLGDDIQTLWKDYTQHVKKE